MIKTLNFLHFYPSDQQDGEEKRLAGPGRTLHSSQALAEACRFISNDAKFVNDRARNDIILLSRYMSI